MKPIIAYLLILFYFLWLADITNSDVRIVTETSYGKEVNGNAGLEMLVKGTIKLSQDIDIKIGVSEGYTAFRNAPYSLNHAGTRLDIGFLWALPHDFQIGYTHSERRWFEGASPVDVFDYDSIDTITIRKEFKL